MDSPVLASADSPSDSSAPGACDVTVVVPTYCEAANLPVLVPRIASALTAAGLRGEIVVVDDDSPDDTVPACKELALSYPLRLVVRKAERGLARAVVRGMQEAHGSVLVVMDADLSHPPELIPALVQAIRSDEADFVIGSRYVRGGGVEHGWSLFRRLNSYVATLLARPLTSARDPLAGFFALRRTLFEAGGAIDPVGFKIGLELLVKCGCRRVKEIPILFQDRQRGQSKLNFKEQLRYLRHLGRLYTYRFRRCLGGP